MPLKTGVTPAHVNEAWKHHQVLYPPSAHVPKPSHHSHASPQGCQILQIQDTMDDPGQQTDTSRLRNFVMAHFDDPAR